MKKLILFLTLVTFCGATEMVDVSEKQIKTLEAELNTVYLVTFEFKKSSFTLDIWQHAKDSMQAIQITIPVNKKFYDSVRKGQLIDSSFRAASFVSSGALSSYSIRIVDKKKH
jgi:hypothetical protein